MLLPGGLGRPPMDADLEGLPNTPWMQTLCMQTPLEVDPLDADPHEQTPWRQTPWRQTPPEGRPPVDRMTDRLTNIDNCIHVILYSFVIGKQHVLSILIVVNCTVLGLCHARILQETKIKNLIWKSSLLQ